MINYQITKRKTKKKWTVLIPLDSEVIRRFLWPLMKLCRRSDPKRRIECCDLSKRRLPQSTLVGSHVSHVWFDCGSYTAYYVHPSILVTETYMCQYICLRKGWS